MLRTALMVLALVLLFGGVGANVVALMNIGSDTGETFNDIGTSVWVLGALVLLLRMSVPARAKPDGGS